MTHLDLGSIRQPSPYVENIMQKGWRMEQKLHGKVQACSPPLLRSSEQRVQENQTNFMKILRTHNQPER